MITFYAPRHAKLSLMAAIEAILESTDYFSPAFTVYYEDNLREDAKKKWPFCYILDANVDFEIKYLPVVVVFPRWAYKGIELSSTKLWYCDLSVEVYGRNRGEREVIAAAVVQGLSDTFTIYDYSGSTPSSWGTATIFEDGAGEYWSMWPDSVGDELSVEGTLNNWMALRTRFWCKAS